MSVKFIVFAAIMTVRHFSAVPVGRADADYSSFTYDVADPTASDYSVKSQAEIRVGDSASGQYSVLDNDSTKRTVDYVAADVNGLNDVVPNNPIVISTLVVATTALPAPVIATATNIAAGRAIPAATIYATNPASSLYPGIVAPTLYSSPSVYAASSFYPVPSLSGLL